MIHDREPKNREETPIVSVIPVIMGHRSVAIWATASPLAFTHVGPQSEANASVEAQDMCLSSPAVRTIGP
jgi:hypothetical protein